MGSIERETHRKQIANLYASCAYGLAKAGLTAHTLMALTPARQEGMSRETCQVVPCSVGTGLLKLHLVA